MTRAGGGAIVNVCSTAALRPLAGKCAYSATKWALRGMTKSAAMDLAKRNIRVNSVHPGPIETEMLKGWAPQWREARLKAVPMQRAGTVDEVAPLVLFLLSDEAAYITGAEIAIDGGVTA
jgi:3alpha(or 20beta)-hydroxysteroid dehydrogenase